MNHVISGSDALDTVFAAIGTSAESSELAAALGVLGGEFTAGPVRREGRETTQYVESRAGGVEVLVTDE